MTHILLDIKYKNRGLKETTGSNKRGVSHRSDLKRAFTNLVWFSYRNFGEIDTTFIPFWLTTLNPLFSAVRRSWEPRFWLLSKSRWIPSLRKNPELIRKCYHRIGEINGFEPGLMSSLPETRYILKKSDSNPFISPISW